MKKIVSLFLALTMALSLAACGSKTGEQAAAGSGTQKEDTLVKEISSPVEIQFWHSISNPVHAGILENLIKEFNDTVGQEKGITVVPTFNGSSSELYSNVIAAIKAGNAPDVTLALRPYVADYLQTDYVVDLAPYISDPDVGISDYNDIFEGLRNANSNYEKEGTYSLPIHSYSEVLYYNVDFFEKNNLTVPTTWDEMVDTCSKIREITGAPAFGWDNLAGSFMTLVKQFGGRYTDQNGNIYFANEDTDVALKVLNLWKDNVDCGIWRTAGEDMFFSGPFANQQVQMYLSSGNEGEFINMKIPESAKFEWSCAPIPQFEDGTKADYAEGFLISMLDNTNDLATRWASWIFVQYMQSYEVCQKINSGESRLPFLKSVAASDEFLNSAAPAQLAGVEQQDFAYTYPGFETDTYTSSGLHDYVVIAMDNILNNGADVRAELEKLISTLQ